MQSKSSPSSYKHPLADHYLGLACTCWWLSDRLSSCTTRLLFQREEMLINSEQYKQKTPDEIWAVCQVARNSRLTWRTSWSRSRSGCSQVWHLGGKPRCSCSYLKAGTESEREIWYDLHRQLCALQGRFGTEYDIYSILKQGHICIFITVQGSFIQNSALLTHFCVFYSHNV